MAIFRPFWVIFAFSDFHQMISSQVFGIVYHLNGLSGNTNIRYNQFPAQDMIFFNFEKKRIEIKSHKANKIDAF